MWMDAEKWLGMGVLATHVPGLTLAFTEAECELVELRAQARRAFGAPIEVITPARAREIEPGVHPSLLKAGYCEIDGFASACLTGRAFRHALVRAGVDVIENAAVEAIDSGDAGHVVHFGTAIGRAPLRASRIVLAGGVWIENMLAWLGVQIPIKVLINQLIVTERIRPVMRTVLSVANGLLSLKQFANGTVLIGGGHLATPDQDRNETVLDWRSLAISARTVFELFPVMRSATIVRAGAGIEARTKDELPVFGPSARHAGLYHQFGFSLHGFQLGPGAGAVMTELIASGGTQTRIGDLGIERFHSSPP